MTRLTLIGKPTWHVREFRQGGPAKAAWIRQAEARVRMPVDISMAVQSVAV